MFKKSRFLSIKKLFIIALVLLLTSCSKFPFNTIAVEPGVSQELAVYRKSVISDVRYELQFTIPAEKNAPIPARGTIVFSLKKNRKTLQVDFKEKQSHLINITVNEKEIPVAFKHEHILIDKSYLRKGINKIDISFIAGDLSLNRNEDYLYTLLVPDRARTVFPCFDQPDIKASFQLSLTIPKEWKAVCNAPLNDSIIKGNAKTYHFKDSDPVSTYLFSFVAGKFSDVSHSAGRNMHFYHRETDTSKINHSIQPVFGLHKDALSFLENYTAINYPFKKFDFVAIPDFQYGGMEHPGAIQYKASLLFLDSGATKDEELDRASLIAHETAHMWFGDLVTMQWFNDVWMKEVFANFMASKITNISSPAANYDLEFLLDHFPPAYNVDRTKGTNPIRQKLENLNEAGSLYGNIIYHKAPIIMRQLEQIMGEEPFRDGLREYLKIYSNSNATWPQLINILDTKTELDLKAWNKVWVDEPGRPVIDYTLSSKEGRIDKLIVTQKGEDSSNRIWPQVFDVALVYADRTEKVQVQMNKREVELKEATNKPLPLYILFNPAGQGYGLFPVDTAMLKQPVDLSDAVMRASAYINLYENMLSGRSISPLQLLNFHLVNGLNEPEELSLTLVAGQLTEIYWRLLLPERRREIAANLEQSIWDRLEKEQAPNKKKILFRIYQSIALTNVAQDRLYAIWNTRQPPNSVVLTEDDYTSLSLALAVRDYPDPTIMQQQLVRIKNDDRKKRLQFITPALSADTSVRDAFFESLKKEETREKEAWVLSALNYLHHPLRANASQKYLKSSLELLEEIQKTGDIFFPQSWLSATFGSYLTGEAATIVEQFLDSHPNYNAKLKAKILQSTDALFRAARLVGAR